jgi:hypothetical protein
VTPEVAAEFDALIAKVQSGEARLSHCLAEGVALARRLEDGALRGFCERELQPYSLREGEIAPSWRQAESYKLWGFRLGAVQEKGFAEGAILQMLSQHPDVRLTQDFWHETIADAEELLTCIAERAKSGTGFALPISEMTVTAYGENVRLQVVMPTAAVRRVIAKTRAEFTRRLLEVRGRLAIKKPTRIARAWGSTRGFVYSVTEKSSAAAVSALMLFAIASAAFAWWGLKLNDPSYRSIKATTRASQP